MPNPQLLIVALPLPGFWGQLVGADFLDEATGGRGGGTALPGVSPDSRNAEDEAVDCSAKGDMEIGSGRIKQHAGSEELLPGVERPPLRPAPVLTDFWNFIDNA
jgi:hypothetical protein